MATKWARGRTLFTSIGCADCHVPDIILKTTRYRLLERGARGVLDIDLAEHGAPPRLAPRAGKTTVSVRLFSDLKRHRMGEVLADSRDSHGIAADTFITPPLWGLARSRPYLHDGRAPTIEDAILLHGGEAQRVRDAYAGLDENDRGALRVFLISLNRARRFTAR